METDERDASRPARLRALPTTARDDKRAHRGAPQSHRGRIRDIYVARVLREAPGAEPKPVHNDNGRLPRAVNNGPMLSARGRTVVLAWFTVTNDVGHAYAAFSADAGRTFGTPIRLDQTSALGARRRRGAAGPGQPCHVDRFANQNSSFRCGESTPRRTRSLQ